MGGKHYAKLAVKTAKNKAGYGLLYFFRLVHRKTLFY
jgi:hypothetical protein